MFLAELNKPRLKFAEIVTRDSRPQMVYNLKLQATMKPVHPRMAIDIHTCSDLFLDKAVAVIFGHFSPTIDGHRKVAEGDLNVQEACDVMRKHKESNPRLPGRKTKHEAYQPYPETSQKNQVNLLRFLWRIVNVSTETRGLKNTLRVQIESCKSHYWKVCIVLILNKSMCYRTQRKVVVVERREDRSLKESFVKGKDWEVLNIRVVLNRVCANVVSIVAAFPPADADSSAEISKEQAKPTIELSTVSYPIVTQIVTNESSLLPEQAKQNPGKAVYTKIIAQQDSSQD